MTNVLVVTTPVRVLNRVHSHTTHLRPAVALNLVLVVAGTSLKHRLVATTTTRDLTDRRAATRRNRLLRARRELDTGEARVKVVGDQDAVLTGRLGQGTAVTELGLDVANDRTLRHGAERQNVTDRQLRLLTGVHELTGVRTFRRDEELIRQTLERFLKQPDVYADPWNLRRSIDASDTALLEDWFFNQGGRGAQPSRGTRPRNILVSAALIAVIGELYGDQFQCLVLAGGPERLGEWRRGLQDALGLGREDFGPSSGIVLFERPEALVERADRLEERGEVPLILIDAAERSVDIPVLQFPLWLAFAARPGERLDDDDLL